MRGILTLVILAFVCVIYIQQGYAQYAEKPIRIEHDPRCPYTQDTNFVGDCPECGGQGVYRIKHGKGCPNAHLKESIGVPKKCRLCNGKDYNPKPLPFTPGKVVSGKKTVAIHHSPYCPNAVMGSTVTRGHVCPICNGGRKAIPRNASIDYPDSRGRTALYLAVQHGDVEVIRFLLDHGANPYAAAKDGKTPRMLAEKKGEIVKRLFRDFDLQYPPDGI